jgi:hypothetical protein
MDNNKETILKYIEALQNQIKIRDSDLLRFREEKQNLIDIINKDSKPYKRAIMILCVMLMIESGIIIYHLLM